MIPTAKPKPYLSARDYAEIFGCSERTVRRWIADGRLQSIRMGGLRRILNPLRRGESRVGDAAETDEK
jgi:excisionase family DNA binding protein